MDKILNDFKQYLRQNPEISGKTVKFYLSDINHFANWFMEHLANIGVIADNLEEALPHLSLLQANNYRQYLINSNIAISTANRKLSTLRKFSQFLAVENLAPNFTEDLNNIENSTSKQSDSEGDYLDNLVNSFEKFLKDEDVTANTIKNYTADLRKFSRWLEINV